jgi:hypothetical protein
MSQTKEEKIFILKNNREGEKKHVEEMFKKSLEMRFKGTDAEKNITSMLNEIVDNHMKNYDNLIEKLENGEVE